MVQLSRVNIFVPEEIRVKARKYRINMSECSRMAIEKAVQEKENEVIF